MERVAHWAFRLLWAAFWAWVFTGHPLGAQHFRPGLDMLYVPCPPTCSCYITEETADSAVVESRCKLLGYPTRQALSAIPRRRYDRSMPKNKTQRSRPVKTPAPRRPSKAAVQHLPQKLQETLSALTYLEYQFVLNYVGKARGNGTLAAQLAGMGNSYATNASQASMLLQKATVRQAIDAWMTQFALSAAELTWQVRDISQANMSPFVQWQADGTLKLKTLDEETWLAHAHWIKEIETDPKSGQVLKIVLHDAQAARRDLAKILKLYSDAPIFLFGMQARQMSDAELIAQLEAVRAEEKAQGRLAPTTGQVAVVPAPEDQP